MSKWIFGVVLFLVAAVSWAQTKKSDPRLQYVGAITINSANPKALAGWYTEKLGLDASSEYHGFYYGSLTTKSGDFHLGIHPLPAGAKIGSPNISITLRVSDFRSYTTDLRSRGLVPLREENDATGHFFTLKDLDGNEVTIWGE
ncbi:MAG: VOC family protein [Acidobacteriota bacterium]|nr:VOC family protein [Acidobacteriota bacterium]